MLLVVNANSNTCRFYECEKEPLQLKKLKEITHSESKLKDSDLMSDKQGHYQNSDNASRGAFSPHSDPHQVEVDKFAREIANALEEARNQNAFNKVIFIAESRMSGWVHEHLNKNVAEKMINIHKDLIHMNEAQLTEYLKEHKKEWNGSHL